MREIGEKYPTQIFYQKNQYRSQKQFTRVKRKMRSCIILFLNILRIFRKNFQIRAEKQPRTNCNFLVLLYDAVHYGYYIARVISLEALENITSAFSVSTAPLWLQIFLFSDV